MVGENLLLLGRLFECILSGIFGSLEGRRSENGVREGPGGVVDRDGKVACIWRFSWEGSL